MELKEALETMRPVLMALNVVMLKQDELNSLDRQLREAKDLAGKIESMKARLLEAQTEQANVNAKKVEAQRTAEQLVADAKVQAARIELDAQKNAQAYIDQKLESAKDRFDAAESKVIEAREKLTELERQIAEDLRRHNEILDSLKALKAKL